MSMTSENTVVAAMSKLMSPNEASFATTMSKTLLAKMSKERAFPQPLLIGVKRIAYVRAEVEAWIDQRISARTVH
jgi:prophage regulatory protein